MLSKKMTVSLIGFNHNLALAFVAPSAMAATFDVALDESNDVSEASGLQLQLPSDNKLKVTVMFEQAVILTAADISVSGFTMKGVYIPAVKRSGDLPTDASDSIELTIDITADTSRVSLKIAKDIKAADAFSTDTSAEFTADIGVLKDDTMLDPEVYGIRRVDRSVLPLTGGAVNVIITLSEEPQSFTAAHINVTKATAGAPVKLPSVAQNQVGLGQFSDVS